MKILTGEEARKAVEEVSGGNALTDEEMEGVDGGFSHTFGSLGGREVTALLFTPDERKWFKDTYTGRMLYKRIIDNLDESEIGRFENQGFLRIWENQDFADEVVGCLHENGLVTDTLIEQRWP